MSTVVIIPARYGSSRYPGKPLAKIAGMMMIERVWRLASQLKHVAGVYVATDDRRIKQAVTGFGGQVIMTPDNCENGTERVFAAAKQISPTPQNVINFQGDALLTPPWIVQPLVDILNDDKDVQIVTPMLKLSQEQLDEMAEQKKISPASGTTVTFDNKMNALYFSKNIIPHVRKGPADVYRHIGMYGYRMDTLETYLNLPMGKFEKMEQLEQLRAMEHGIPIRVVAVDFKGRTPASVDSPEDVAYAERIIAREGELV